MKPGYRYCLASNKFPKITCLVCGAKKHWQRYYDTMTGEVLPEQYGCCDNAIKCGSSLNPYSDGYDKMIAEQERGNFSSTWKFTKPVFRPLPTPKPETVFIPYDVFASTRLGYEQNTFIQNLLSHVPFPFESGDVEKVIAQYHLGTVCEGYMAGGITFPFIDIAANVRTIQVKQFDQANHTTGQGFLHSIIENRHNTNNRPLPEWLQAYKRNEKIVSCLFGEHLLSKFPQNPVALVEAPKNAIYGSLYFGFPDNPKKLLWLAVYNLSSLTLDKCKVLKGRKVVLFPDLSKNGHAFRQWENKAKEFNEALKGTETRFRMSDLLEKLAPNELKEKGADIADVLSQMDWREFRPEIIKSEIIIVKDLPAQTTTTKNENGEASNEPYLNDQINGNTQSHVTDIADSPKAKFKSDVAAEALETRYANCDKWFDIHKPDPADAWNAIIELSKEEGFNIEPEYQIKSVNSPQIAFKRQPSARVYKEDWTREINELELFFSGITLPTEPYKLNPYCTIINVREFIDTSIERLRANNGNNSISACINRLRDLQYAIQKDTF